MKFYDNYNLRMAEAFVLQIRCSKKLGVDLFWVTLVLDVSLYTQRVLIPHLSFYGTDPSEVR